MQLVLTGVAALLLTAAGVALGWRLGLRSARREREKAEVVSGPPPRPVVSRRLDRAVEGVRVASEVGALSLSLAPQLAGSLRALVAWAESERPDMRRFPTARDGTVSLFFSDIEGSTELCEALGDEAWLGVLRGHDSILRRAVRSNRGQVIKTQGDSVMAVFVEAAAAATCAIAVQRSLAAWTPPHSAPPILVRIGLHSGEAIRRGRDFFGVNVAIAARVAAEAGGGEILVSGAVRKRLGGSDIRLGRGRRVELKGLSATQTLYPLRWPEPAAAPR